MIVTKKQILINKKIITIKQLGIGYIYQFRFLFKKMHIKNIRNYKNEIIAFVCRFSDIKKNKAWYYFYFKTENIISLINDIIKFNIHIDNDKSELKKEYEKMEFDSLFEIVDIFASEYGWSINEILENVTYKDSYYLLKKLHKRKENDRNGIAILNSLAYHNPKELGKRVKESNGWKTLSLDEAIKMNKRDNNGK